MGLFKCGSRCQRRRDRKDRKQELKWQHRQNRVNRRHDSRQSAYAHGINPSAWVGDAVDNVADIASNFIPGANTFQSPVGNTGIGGALKNYNGTQGRNKNLMPILMVGALIFFFKKMR